MASFFVKSSASVPKKKVVFVLGSTATGKSKLAVGLALRFGGEVINSDKMQVYAGLDVITNKVTPEESAAIPHNLLGFLPPEADFTAADFRLAALRAVKEVIRRGHLPIVAGGSNTYIKELVDGNGGEFTRLYECCFVWVDVDREVLESFVAERVEKMVERGLVDEARAAFDWGRADYAKGIWRSIGVPEMDRYLRREAAASPEEKEVLLREAFEKIKENTQKLAAAQREKILRFLEEDGWELQHVDATAAVLLRAEESAEEVWENEVLNPSVEIVSKFLDNVAEVAPAVAARGRSLFVAKSMAASVAGGWRVPVRAGQFK
ncbi:hypothetical protein HPP92_027868 [Vanilla planifolia]|uniref:adenylate dimethylallyltransferase (ADP/ATP-dependent) n=1 Tax=Vanilla planifolia TaxID=51239 RepID=A0A835U4E1_VANPL|nr:hypothetical protein HPP92_027868 [Vanilla planifolia]